MVLKVFLFFFSDGQLSGSKRNFLHFLANVFPCFLLFVFFFNTVGTLLHILPSSHFSNLRIDVIASKGDIVVSYDEKTLIMWDMGAGVQKASFTADKVRKPPFYFHMRHAYF